MLQNAEGVDEVERPGSERQRVDVALHYQQIRMVTQVRLGRVYGGRVVERDDARTCQQSDLCEPPRATAHVEHELPFEILGSPLGRSPEALGRDRVTRVTVELRLAEPVPLHAEVVGVIGFGNEARNSVANRVAVQRVVGDQPRFDAIDCPGRGMLDAQRPTRVGTAQNVE